MTVAGIDGSMAHLSDGLFTTAIATYALAMVGFVAEYSFGKRGRIAATVPIAAPKRELGSVGAAGPSGHDETPAEHDDSITPVAPNDLGKRPLPDRLGRAARRPRAGRRAP